MVALDQAIKLDPLNARAYAARSLARPRSASPGSRRSGPRSPTRPRRSSSTRNSPWGTRPGPWRPRWARGPTSPSGSPPPTRRSGSTRRGPCPSPAGPSSACGWAAGRSAGRGLPAGRPGCHRGDPARPQAPPGLHRPRRRPPRPVRARCRHGRLRRGAEAQSQQYPSHRRDGRHLDGQGPERSGDPGVQQRRSGSTPGRGDRLSGSAPMPTTRKGDATRAAADRKRSRPPPRADYIDANRLDQLKADAPRFVRGASVVWRSGCQSVLGRSGSDQRKSRPRTGWRRAGDVHRDIA